jgi:predicted ferric reductase
MIFGASTLWYLSRATGVVSVVLLTVVVILGVVTAGRRRPDGASATVTMGIHRWLSMGMLVFLITHIITAIVDGYVDISWLAIVVPFISAYEPLLVGFGAIGVDLLVAILVTSFLRHRIPERRWRFIHWATYGMWLIAVIHGFSFGTADQPVLRLITLGCGVVGGLFASWRVASSFADRHRRTEIAAQEWT